MKQVMINFDGKNPRSVVVDGEVFKVESNSPTPTNPQPPVNLPVNPPVNPPTNEKYLPRYSTELLQFTSVKLFETINPDGTVIKQAGTKKLVCFDRPGKYTLKIYEVDYTKDIDSFKLENTLIYNVPDITTQTYTRIEDLSLSSTTPVFIPDNTVINFNTALTIRRPVIGGKNVTLNFTGTNQSFRREIRVSDDCYLANLRIVNAHNPKERDGVSDAINAGNRTSYINCVFDNWRSVFNLNHNPTQVLISKCAVEDMWDYFVWMQGSDIFIEQNTVLNSRREHVIRGHEYNGVYTSNNVFTNADLRPADPKDFSKGCQVVQRGRNFQSSFNIAKLGGIGFGPLGRGDGVKEVDASTIGILSFADTVINASLELWHGLNGFVVYEPNANIRWEVSEPGYTRKISNGTIYSSKEVKIPSGVVNVKYTKIKGA